MYMLTYSIKLIRCFLCITFAEAMATSGKTEKSPHDQEIKFFAKVAFSFQASTLSYHTQNSLET